MADAKLTVVLDACLSYRLARMLAGYNEKHPTLTIIAMRDVLSEDTSDVTWLTTLPVNPIHIVITRDDILTRLPQIAAWTNGGLTVIVIDRSLGNIKRPALAALLLTWWPAIERTIRKFPRGRAFAIKIGPCPSGDLPAWTPQKKRIRPQRAKNTADGKANLSPAAPKSDNSAPKQGSLPFRSGPSD